MTTLMPLEEMCQCLCLRRFIIVNLLCIQSPSVQFWDWRTNPSQSFPPFLGAGLLHSLLLHWVHSVPQADHLLQSVHTPSTGGEGGCGKETREWETQKDKRWEGKEMRPSIMSSMMTQTSSSIAYIGRKSTKKRIKVECRRSYVQDRPDRNLGE